MARLSVIIVATATSICTFFLVRFFWQRCKHYNQVPARWKRVGEVTGLTLYPLKSGQGIPLNTAECAHLGLVDVENPHLHLRDREFIVFDDEKKTAISGLINSRMVLMKTKADDDSTVRFSFPGQDDFFLSVPVDSSKVVQLKRWWGEHVDAVDCGDKAAVWFSHAFLKNPCGLRLGCFMQPPVTARTVQNGWSEFAKIYARLRSEYLGAYAYMASYLIITEESMAEVNSRLLDPVSERQYRANILIRGSPAYSEDDWDWLRLGESVIMRGFKPCTRCAVIAINVDTGALHPKLEPLRTLKEYRQVKTEEEKKLSGSEPVFGLYAGLHWPGIVRLGDPVYIGVE